MVLALDKEKIAKCFRRSLHSYDDAATVQNRLAGRLMQLTQGLPEHCFADVLEIGCGTGMLTELLCSNRSINQLYLNDLVSDFESLVKKKIAADSVTVISSCFGDIESISLPEKLSLVISGASFQWLTDMPVFLTKLAECMCPGSYLAFSLFGPGTLLEFSTLSSFSLHYHTNDEIVSMLQDDFILEMQNTWHDQLFFANVLEIMNHIRDTGVGGVSEYRWTRQNLDIFEKKYILEFGQDKGLPVSYSSSCFIARRR